MGVISKTEVNLRRLLATAPQQKNQAKLIHYVATLREQLEQLAAETTEDGLQRISNAKVSDYSEKLEALAATSRCIYCFTTFWDPCTSFFLSSCQNSSPKAVSSESLEAFDGDWVKEIPSKPEQGTYIPSPRLRRRSHYKVEDRSHEIKESDSSAPIKLDAEAHADIDKHRKLQEDLTDEMVGLAQRLKRE